MKRYSPVPLIEYNRSGLIEQEHLGFILKMNKNGEIFKVGDDLDYPFFLRSCAKPLQAALLIDYGIIETFGLNTQQIALCCASHAGEEVHSNIALSILDKIGVKKEELLCGFHKPISKSSQEHLLLEGLKEDVLQNNCSGKHSMMLAICKKMGWDTGSYDKNTHPLQIAIKNKIYELCELEKEYPITKDGCGVPIHSMPLKNMLKGYLNLLLDKKYAQIKEAFINHSYIIGGEDRLDTAIMTANNNLIAKVGAGGICIVLNLKAEEAVIIKIMDSDMKARAIALLETLSQLNWLDQTQLEQVLIKQQNKREIKTLHKEIIGEIQTPFSLN